MSSSTAILAPMPFSVPAFLCIQRAMRSASAQGIHTISSLTASNMYSPGRSSTPVGPFIEACPFSRSSTA